MQKKTDRDYLASLKTKFIDASAEKNRGQDAVVNNTK
jgi:hypothetical protein